MPNYKRALYILPLREIYGLFKNLAGTSLSDDFCNLIIKNVSSSVLENEYHVLDRVPSFDKAFTELTDIGMDDERAYDLLQTIYVAISNLINESVPEFDFDAPIEMYEFAMYRNNNLMISIAN